MRIARLGLTLETVSRALSTLRGGGAR
ncbi:hypothetical protein [Bradyrhizobium sp. S3.9.1]